jgi:Glycosyl-4,4'-diaponeurosporenoate acyltransferase
MSYMYQELGRRVWRMPQSSAFDIWFQPKCFESEHLYERLGALVLKRYVPTGSDLVMRLLRRHYPGSRWVTSSLQSLQDFERRTRLNEFIHLIAFIGFTVLTVVKFACAVRTDRRPGCERNSRILAGSPAEIQPAAPVSGHRNALVSLDRRCLRFKHFHPLLAFLIPTTLIGYGVVIPRSCIAGVNQLSAGFASTLLGTVIAYWQGMRFALRKKTEVRKKDNAAI